jgi:hypothetical protein
MSAQAGHRNLGHYLAFLNLTPSPPPFSAMNSTPADSSARPIPAIYDWQVWMKWEVLEHFLDADFKDGHALDRRTIVALACIKADIMHFGFGK